MRKFRAFEIFFLDLRLRSFLQNPGCPPTKHYNVRDQERFFTCSLM